MLEIDDFAQLGVPCPLAYALGSFAAYGRRPM
jgi:hypothetical protein